MIAAHKASRPLVAGLAVIAVIASVLTAHSPAEAARATDLAPGYIISDAEFLDSNAMTASQVQQFLERQVPRCRPDLSSGPDDPITCLKDFRTVTESTTAGNCTAIKGGRSVSAAELIDLVARACGISQEVLLATLQKEVGLVTMTAPSQWRFDYAMGYACPDTGTGGSAQCQAQRKGFFKQIFFAARVYKDYVNNPQNWTHRAGQTNNIAVNVPERGCGTQSVYIENRATAALYNYTPYVPNAASLNAGSGEGDRCSAYGNRNFYLFYTDWFGLPNRPTGAIGDRFNASGGTSGAAGAPVTPEFGGLTGGGAWQRFSRGLIHWSPATGARITSGAIGSSWTASGSENGALGYPSGNENGGLRNGGSWQQFEKGKIHWSPSTGAHRTIDGSAVQGLWAQSNWENGALGYPATEEFGGLVRGGAWQRFEGGTVHWSPASGARWTKTGSAIQNAWIAQGWENGRLGYPTTNETESGSGSEQAFEGGSIRWDRATGATTVRYR
jgi:hypothetical protein